MYRDLLPTRPLSYHARRDWRLEGWFGWFEPFELRFEHDFVLEFYQVGNSAMTSTVKRGFSGTQLVCQIAAECLPCRSLGLLVLLPFILFSSLLVPWLTLLWPLCLETGRNILSPSKSLRNVEGLKVLDCRTLQKSSELFSSILAVVPRQSVVSPSSYSLAWHGLWPCCTWVCPYSSLWSGATKFAKHRHWIDQSIFSII